MRLLCYPETIRARCRQLGGGAAGGGGFKSRVASLLPERAKNLDTGADLLLWSGKIRGGRRRMERGAEQGSPNGCMAQIPYPPPTASTLSQSLRKQGGYLCWTPFPGQRPTGTG
ncbi:hypothetical protein ZWY2020_043732 [Hordeum vulgare]|nr:hypothetical protein ZWY2020_043732 [Hordeum vulgare]